MTDLVYGTIDLEALKAELIRDEGIRLFPYKDTVGVLTIGIGHNLDAKGLSRPIIEAIFAEDMDEVLTGLATVLPWWQALDGVRKRVLANMAFNLGLAGLLRWPNTLAMIANGEYEDAARSMRVSLWYRQVGNRAERLAQMMETGEA